MSTITQKPLPKKLVGLVQEKVPLSITNEREYDKTLKLIDRLMQIPKLSKDQAIYLHTLADLVHCYEEEHYAIDTSDITPLDILKSLLEEHEMNASDLGRLLGGSVSLGSKILKGQRDLTLRHMKILGERFCLSPSVFVQ